MEQLHASWEFLSVYQFFRKFSSFFCLPSYFSIDKLEQALLQEPDEELDRSSRESSVSSTASQLPNSRFLSTFIILAVKPLLTQRQKYKINAENYEDYLAKVYTKSRAPFSELTLMEKVKLLKALEDMYMETDNESFLSFKNENCTPESLVKYIHNILKKMF